MSLAFYEHVDVFSSAPYSGNSLAVFTDSAGLTGAQMLRITQELRHFEATFLEATSEPSRWTCRVFDLFEELPFAGHPIIGAAAVLHRDRSADEHATWTFDLARKTVTVRTRSSGAAVSATLDQGAPEFGGVVGDRAGVARAFGLDADELHPDLPVEVVSTGLRYLVVPVLPGALERARIVRDITPLVRAAGADFAVLFDDGAVEARHWNNDGILEDVATGSAAGTIGAYRLRHGLSPAGTTFRLHQGRFTGRPSTLLVTPIAAAERIESVEVGGDVAFVGRGVLDVLP